MGERAARRACWAALTVALLVACLAAPAAAKGAVQVDTVIAGRPVAGSTDAHPVTLRPDDAVTVTVTVHNGGTAVLDASTVRIEGRAVGLPFFAYDTAIGLQVPPGATEQRTFQVDLSNLSDQATGLIPASVKLLNADHHVVGSQSLVTDVRGSMRSVYGTFGVLIAVLTVGFLLLSIYDLGTQRTSPNRWWRGVRFAAAGFGVGLIAVFTLSATRVFAPGPTRWLPIVLVSTAIGFACGYVTPTPDLDDEDEDRDVHAQDAPATSDAVPSAPATERTPVA